MPMVLRRCALLLIAVVAALPSALVALDAPPTIATPARSTPSTVTGTTAALSVVGADDGGAAALLYAWSATGPGQVTFSATGTNAAKTVTATFKTPGDYICAATVSDVGGQTVTSSVAVQVVSTLTSLAISPTSAVVNPGTTKLFAGTAKNQFGTVLTSEPLTWTFTSASGADSVDANGLFTAGAIPGAASVAVVDGAKSAKATIRVNATPTITLTPILTPVAGITVPVSATGADSDDALTSLTYTWTATGPKAVSFTPNGTNVSASAIAKFAAAGDYTLTVTVKDPAGLTASASQSVSVTAVVTAVAVSPNASSTVVNPGSTKPFTAAVKDQFGTVMAGMPVAWSASPATAASVNSTGVVSGVSPAAVTVQAACGSVVGVAPLRVNAAPSVTLAPVDPVATTTATLTATGSDPDDAASTLKYTWAATGPKAVAFSPNGTAVSGSTTATFAAAGTYTVTVTISDPAGLSAKASQTVVVQRVGTNPIASPASLVVRQAGETRTITMSAVDQFGASYTPTITAIQATGGAATAAGGTATFVSDGSYAATNISVTVDTVPAQTVTIPVQQLSYPGLGTGLDAAYFDNIDLTGTSVSRTDSQVSFTWANGASPISGIAPNTWSARWTGYIVAPISGAITLATNSDDGIEVWVDRKPVIRNWTDHGPTRNTGTVAMAAGQKYEIIVNYYNNTNSGVAQLLWSYASQPEVIIPSSYLIAANISGAELPPGNGTGFTVSYYNNDYFAGAAVGTATATAINNAWGTKPPVAGITGFRWSGIWRGVLEAPLTDTYTFMVSYTGSVLVYLDGALVLNGAQRATNGMVSVAIPLTAGSRHPIEIRYANPDTSASLALHWSATGILPAILPGNRIFAPATDNTPFFVGTINARVNPAWIAGQAPRSATGVTAQVDGKATHVVRGGTQWFIDTASVAGLPPGLVLQAGQTRNVSVSVEGKTESNVVTWETIDLANTYGIDPMTLRRGDSLLLTHAGSGEVLELDVDYHVAPATFQPAYTGTAGQAIPVQFPKAGTFVVKARVGGQLAGSLTVRVVGVDLQGPIACEILYQRSKDVLVTHPDLVSFKADDELSLLCSLNSTIPGGQRLNLRPISGSPSCLQARLGSDGPVIAYRPIDSFMLETTAKRVVPVEETYPDGSRLCFAALIQSPHVGGLVIKMNCFKSGVTFEDGQVNKTISTSEFTSIPSFIRGEARYVYRLIMAGSVSGGVCHSFVAYQNSVQVSY